MALPWLIGGAIALGVINAIADEKTEAVTVTTSKIISEDEVPKEIKKKINKDSDGVETVIKQVPYSKVPKWARQ